jgi:hypothetical protein
MASGGACRAQPKAYKGMIVKSFCSRNATQPLFNAVEITSDTRTGPGGLVLFSLDFRNLEIFDHVDRLFGSLRLSSKGIVGRSSSSICSTSYRL